MMYLTILSFLQIGPKAIVYLALLYVLIKCINDHYSRNPRWVEFSNELPGPRVYPIVGNTLAIMIGARAGLGKLLVNYMNTYGPTFRLWFGQCLGVVLSDVNDVETVFMSSNCFERKQIASFFAALFESSLPAAPLPVWKHKRKIFQSFFAKNAVLNLVQEINEVNDRYVEKMKKEVNGPEFNLKQYMNNLSFDIIMKTHLNYDMSDEEKKQLNITQKLNEVIMRTFFKWFFRSSLVQTIVQWLKPVNIARTKKKIHDFLDKVIDLNRKSPRWSSGEEDMTENYAQSYINTLYKMKEELNEANLVHSEVLTLFVGGIETTGSTMAFCFLALAAHPDIQEKAYQEIYEVFGDDKRPVDASDLNKFQYLDQVIKETQRLFTIIPTLMRSVEKDTKIGAYTHPAGTIILLNIIGIHHNPDIYPDPNRFNPENFSPEAAEKRHRCSFIPFSAGPRNCIGKEYAEIVMKLRLISFLRIFKFHTNVKLEDIKPRARFIENSSIGFPVSVKFRGKIS